MGGDPIRHMDGLVDIAGPKRNTALFQFIAKARVVFKIANGFVEFTMGV